MSVVCVAQCTSHDASSGRKQSEELRCELILDVLRSFINNERATYASILGYVAKEKKNGANGI